MARAGRWPYREGKTSTGSRAEMLVCSKIQSRYKEWLIRKGIAVWDNKRAMVKGIIQRRMESIG